MALEAGFKKYNTDNFLFYRVNELRNKIIIVYVDDTLSIRYKPELMGTIEFINK